MPTDLVQFGGVGLAFFLGWILYKVISNHEVHFIEMTKQNTEFTKESTNAIKENTRVLAELKDLIISIKK